MIKAGSEIPERLVRDTLVSRETLGKIARYLELLKIWQARTNLVAPSTLSEIWERHVLDSAQLLAIMPQARTWVDLGSGGGFPGLILACAMSERGGHVDLVESNHKKAAFLRHVIVDLDLPAKVHAARIEQAVPNLKAPEVVTARALASLDQLLLLASSLLKSGAIALFPKGRDYQIELTEAHRRWHFSDKVNPSLTDVGAAVLEIRDFKGPRIDP